MPGKNDQPRRLRGKFGPQWILFMIVFGILTLSTLAFMRPIFQGTVEMTPTPTSQPSPSGQSTEDSAPAPEITPTQETPPTPEEIGFTDGIILGSTILIVILLVATLRETLQREGR